MIYTLHQKEEPVFRNTKSLNQYRKIKAKISHEIQPIESFENGTVAFVGLLLSKEESNVDFFSLEDVIIVIIFTIYPKVIFNPLKTLFVINLL